MPYATPPLPACAPLPWSGSRRCSRRWRRSRPPGARRPTAPQRIDAQQRAVAEADAAVGQARTLYDAGLSGLLDVLDAQRTALARRQTLLLWQADAARAAIASFEALGLIDGEDRPA